jgi:hypothetical protein
MTQDYAKMEESSLEQQNIITDLEHTYQDLKEQQVATHIKFDKEKQSFTTQIQNWKGQYETTKVQLNKPSPILPIIMNNRLKEFEELLSNNTLFKV